MNTKPDLFIDDERMPPEGGNWVIVRTSAAAISWIEKNGIPEHISFDHDLGGEDTSMRVVHWLARNLCEPKNIHPYRRYLLYMAGTYHRLTLPKHFSYYVHSQNPVGVTNITSLMNQIIDEVKK